MAVVVPVGRGAAVQDVQGDVAGGGAKHQEAALTQGGVVVAAVTEGTLLQTWAGVSQAGGGRPCRVLRQAALEEGGQRVLVLQLGAGGRRGAGAGAQGRALSSHTAPTPAPLRLRRQVELRLNGDGDGDGDGVWVWVWVWVQVWVRVRLRAR